MATTETICALATPNGNASVGIIRVSGPHARDIAKQITHIELIPRYAHFTSFFDYEDVTIDQGIAIFFPAPHSFTGEDVVEIQPHGNPFICERIIRTLNALGARMALPGEFSERAFINGKLDLTQLEAIADLIASGSELAAKSAVLSMQGKFSEKVNEILQQLIQLRTHIEASLDFSEEDIEIETRAVVGKKLAALDESIADLFVLAEKGVKLQKGTTIVLTGSPNVGKSSLFNALCADDRAIVTNIPGTTRDIVSVDIEINGMPIRLLDTAGIRERAELVEQEGISRAQAAIESSDLVIHVYDCQEDHEEINQKNEKDSLSVINKIDLITDDAKFKNKGVLISAKTGFGLDNLRDEIIQRLSIFPSEQLAPFSARNRHVEALSNSRKHILAGIEHIDNQSSLELAAEELRLAQQQLSEITGEFTPDDLLDYVFREFCIGK